MLFEYYNNMNVAAAASLAGSGCLMRPDVVPPKAHGVLAGAARASVTRSPAVAVPPMTAPPAGPTSPFGDGAATAAAVAEDAADAAAAAAWRRAKGQPAAAASAMLAPCGTG